jgi:hypothetical protein
MDTSLTVRRTAAASPRPAATQAVSTDLAAAKSVAATGSAARIGPDTANAHHPDPSYTGEIVLDAQSREVIYRSADSGSRRVSRVVPEVAARRLKAYARSSQAGEDSHDPHADIEA